VKAAARTFKPLRTLVVLGALALAGFASSGCNANLTPYSAIVNGARITQQQLNDVMGVDRKGAYACLISSGGSTTQIQGSSPDTYSMGYAGLQLSYLVEAKILEQAAAEEGVTVGPIAYAIGKQQINSVFASEAASAGCSTDVLKSMPPALQDALISLEASVYALGAHLVGTELTVDGLQAYAKAHPEDTTQTCVKMIETDSTAKAEQAASEINGGASFEHVAKTSSIAPGASTNGGDLGCFIPSSKLPPAVAHAAATIPIGQLSDPIPAGGKVYLIEVTSRKMLPYTTIGTHVVQSAGSKVGKVVDAKLKSAKVNVNPAYGTWSSSGVTVLPPPTPPSKFLPY
jgi:hypothetical protein